MLNMETNIQIKGIDSLLKKIDKIQAIDALAIVQDATMLVKNEAKMLAPTNKYVSGGDLKRSIYDQVYFKEGQIVGRVYSNSQYANFVEFGSGKVGAGTYPHSVENLNLTYSSKDKWTYYNEDLQTFLTTSGYVARPFLYPALNNNRARIKEIIANGYSKAIRKEL